MAMFSRRPLSLAHLSDEAAARALSKHFGNIVEAAKELGVARPDLSKLIWSNPAILDAAHERMSLFIFVRRDEIMNGLRSSVASVRRRAIDRMAANPGLFGDLASSPAFALLARAGRSRRGAQVDHDLRDLRDRERLEREVAAELAHERDREAVVERQREAAVERERVEVMVERRTLAPPTSTEGWPAWVRRPTRGRGLR